MLAHRSIAMPQHESSRSSNMRRMIHDRPAPPQTFAAFLHAQLQPKQSLPHFTRGRPSRALAPHYLNMDNLQLQEHSVDIDTPKIKIESPNMDANFLEYSPYTSPSTTTYEEDLNANIRSAQYGQDLLQQQDAMKVYIHNSRPDMMLYQPVFYNPIDHTQHNRSYLAPPINDYAPRSMSEAWYQMSNLIPQQSASYVQSVDNMTAAHHSYSDESVSPVNTNVSAGSYEQVTDWSGANLVLGFDHAAATSREASVLSDHATSGFDKNESVPPKSYIIIKESFSDEQRPIRYRRVSVTSSIPSSTENEPSPASPVDTEPDSVTSPSDQGSEASTQQEDRAALDKFLVDMRSQGMSYKDIKRKGKFREAESTLRGRYRVLTKPKEGRVRKPKWNSADIRLLRRAVARHLEDGAYGSKGPKFPWKRISDWLGSHGASYEFSASACAKEWRELGE